MMRPCLQSCLWTGCVCVRGDPRLTLALCLLHLPRHNADDMIEFPTRHCRVCVCTVHVSGLVCREGSPTPGLSDGYHKLLEGLTLITRWQSGGGLPFLLLRERYDVFSRTVDAKIEIRGCDVAQPSTIPFSQSRPGCVQLPKFPSMGAAAIQKWIRKETRELERHGREKQNV